MTTYTVAPLENITTINDHTGFYLSLAAVVVFFIAFIICETWEQELTVKKIFCGILTAAIALGVTSSVSWHSGDYIIYKNEKVVGDFVGYVPEGYITRETSGKTTKDVAHHYVYVQYKINGQYVLFYAQTGQEWPTQAIFYKN